MIDVHDRPRRAADFPLMDTPCDLCGQPMQPPSSKAERAAGVLPLLGIRVHNKQGRCKPCARIGAPQVAEDGSLVARPLPWPDILFGPLPQFAGAACAGVEDPDVFHNIPAGGHIPAEAWTAARVYCAGCPVTDACGADADEYRWRGLWGGSWRTNTGPDYRVRPLVVVPAPKPAAAAVS